MEIKDVKFERLGDANKTYPESTLIIRKQFFDGVVDKLQSTIQRRTEMFIQEREWRIGTGNELHKEYHNSFELREEIRKQKYRRCLGRAATAGIKANYFKKLLFEVLDRVHLKCEEYPFENKIQIYTKWRKLWLKASEQYKQPLEFIFKENQFLREELMEYKRLADKYNCLSAKELQNVFKDVMEQLRGKE